MQRLARLLMMLVFAAGLFAPAGGPARASEAPCPSQAVLECLLPTGHDAIARALASLDQPCHGKAIETERPQVVRGGEVFRALFDRDEASVRGLAATGIDPPPRSV